MVAAPELSNATEQERELTSNGPVRETVAVCDEPLYVADTNTVWLLVIVPAVPVKLAVAAPDPTVTAAGTVKFALLLESDTTAPPAAAACVRVTAQMVVAALPRLVGAQDTELTRACATRNTFVFCELEL